MSGTVVASLAAFFGQQQLSDCTILFYRTTAGATAAVGSMAERVTRSQAAAAATPTRGSKRPATEPPAGSPRRTRRRKESAQVASNVPAAPRGPSADTEPPPPSLQLPAGCVALGEPLPAHSLVLCCGSPRFRAQVKRWSGGQQPPAQAAQAGRVLRVPLEDDGDLPYARAAIKYMYDGTLGADVAHQPVPLLQVRRLAAYLQVEGCVEACDKALLDRVAAPPGPTSLAGVAEMYGIRKVLTRADADSKLYVRVRQACRQQLAASLSSAQTQQKAALPPGPPGGGPDLGELLAWAFGYVPSLLSNPELVRQMRSLPAFAMEALLGCNRLATDDEASVLLLAMTWLEGKHIDPVVRQRLVRLVRLWKVNNTYLLRLLPLMPDWFISARELRYVQQYAGASDDERAWMRKRAAGLCDTSCGWYNTKLRREPSKRRTRSFEWSVDATQLKAAIGSPEPKFLLLDGTFCTAAGSTEKVVANGFEWRPELELIADDKEAVGLFLMCSIPSCLGVSDVDQEEPVGCQPGPCQLALYKWGSDGGSREEACNMVFEANEFLEAGRGQGCDKAIDLAAPAEADGQEPAGASTGAQRLERLEPYIRDGKIWGSLTWLAVD